MVRHIVMWDFKPELTVIEKKEAGERIKALLEPIKDLVPGTVSLCVVVNEMASSNRDIALIGLYETNEALQAYQISPAHVEAAKYVGSVTHNRSCLDFEE